MPRTTTSVVASSRVSRIPYVLGLVFAVLTAGIIVVGYFHYRAEVGPFCSPIAT